ncbi:hypothetical protein C8F01DRAFT_1165416 [Mycena amicta]|nr:hypothetical protein C8F01DRAFT_1165416 [Mycena amicta]
MDVRSRGTLLTSAAGLLYASIGFTLSVLSTLLRLLFPFVYGTRGAEAVPSAISIRRRPRPIAGLSKHRRRSAAPSTLTNLSISSYASTSSSSSEESTASASHPTIIKSKSQSTARRARSRSLERAVHSRNASERLGVGLGRPDFRGSEQRNGRRRSESTPPTPSPRQWAFSQEQIRAPEHSEKERRSSFHHERTPSMDSHAHGGHLSFLHLPKKLQRSTSVISSDSNAIEKRRSHGQLFAPLLHKRKSLDTRRWSGISFASSVDQDEEAVSPDSSSPDEHPLARPNKLRTRPYEAPYFFPAPGSVQAEEYASVPGPQAPRSRPTCSGTLPLPPGRPRPLSGVF